MTPTFILFSLITLISIVISGALLLIRRKSAGGCQHTEHIHPSFFDFYTTLYAFFIGFAIVTLWSAFLTAKTNIAREAESMMIVYRTAKPLPGSEAFRQAVATYVKTVIDVEWKDMERDAMSPEADRRFEDIWAKFYALKDRNDALYTNLTEADRERSNRSTALQGNLYPPVWVILIFGFISVIYGLYFIKCEPTAVSLIYEFMIIFLVLACIYFIYDINTPFSGLINVKPEAFQTVYLRMLSLP